MAVASRPLFTNMLISAPITVWMLAVDALVVLLQQVGTGICPLALATIPVGGWFAYAFFGFVRTHDEARGDKETIVETKRVPGL